MRRRRGRRRRRRRRERFSTILALLKEEVPTRMVKCSTQAVGESIVNYDAALRKLATHCQFGTTLEEALRDCFVCGLWHDTIQRHSLPAEVRVWPELQRTRW